MRNIIDKLFEKYYVAPQINALNAKIDELNMKINGLKVVVTLHSS